MDRIELIIEILKLTENSRILFAMPSRVYVQMKDVSKPSMVKNGDAVNIDKDTGELTVKDAAGELLGWFNNALVTGWWIEREPNDLNDLSEKDISRVLEELKKYRATLGDKLLGEKLS